jgi:purine-binding chemotaxis protein CheW
MPGVMNLRGLVLPIMDLSRLFGLNAIQDTVDSCIVVVEAPLAEETTSVGLLCDGVREVLTLKPEQVEPPPSYGAAVSKHFLSGIAKVDDQLIMLLELRQIFAGILAQHAS